MVLLINLYFFNTGWVWNTNIFVKSFQRGKLTLTLSFLSELALTSLMNRYHCSTLFTILVLDKIKYATNCSCFRNVLVRKRTILFPNFTGLKQNRSIQLNPFEDRNNMNHEVQKYLRPQRIITINSQSEERGTEVFYCKAFQERRKTFVFPNNRIETEQTEIFPSFIETKRNKQVFLKNSD